MPLSPTGMPLPYAQGDPSADVGFGGAVGGGNEALAALLGAGGASALAADQGGGPPEGAGGAQPESADFAKSMLELINEWRQVETDEEDLLAIEKISTLVQMLLTRNAKAGMDAMQGKLR